MFENTSLIFWGAIVLIVCVTSYFNYKTRESKHRLMEKLAEHGQTLPPSITPELMDSITRSDHRGSPLTGALVLIGIGLATAVFFWAMTGGGGLFSGETGAPSWLPVLGLFPFMIGLGLLLSYALDRRPKDQPPVDHL